MGVPQVTQKQVARRNNKEKKLQSMLKDLGIDFDVTEASHGQTRLRSSGQRDNPFGRTSAVTTAAEPSERQEAATTLKKRKQSFNSGVGHPPQKRVAKQSPNGKPQSKPQSDLKC